MKIRQVIQWNIAMRIGALLAMGVVFAAGAHGQTGTNRASAGAIEPAADDLLRKMSDKLKSTQQFTVTGKRTMDPALAQGRTVDTEVTFDLSLHRPNQLRAQIEGNGTKRTFVYDGSQSTLLDERNNVYATVQSAGTIEEMLDGLQEKYGFSPPATDFLVQDPYADLTRDVQSGRVLGRETVGGEECTHLGFTQTDADWDLWLATGDQLPRKFTLTQKNMPGKPRLEVVFTNWDLSPRLETGTFSFKSPQGAQKIEMRPLDQIK